MKDSAERQPALASGHGVTADWLTAALRAAGRLVHGEVESLHIEHWRGKPQSDLYRLHATYVRGSAAPSDFILKVSKPGAPARARLRRWKEHEFYARVAPAMRDAPVPAVYDAAYAADSGQAHLLMEDLTASHTRPPAPLPPTLAQAREAIDCLASIHAVWWAHPDLTGVTAARDDAWTETRTASTRRNTEQFLAEFGDYLPSSTRTALETVSAAWPSLLRRAASPPLTVVHGDAHPWNFLTPHDPRRDRTRLLDWEGWSTEPATTDLASLLALHLPISSRSALEDELLTRYVQRLREQHVNDYDLRACRDDYRRSVARKVLAPVGMWSRGSQTRTWWPVLERVTAAFHDLRCEEVL